MYNVLFAISGWDVIRFCNGVSHIDGVEQVSIGGIPRNHLIEDHQDYISVYTDSAETTNAVYQYAREFKHITIQQRLEMLASLENELEEIGISVPDEEFNPNALSEKVKINLAHKVNLIGALETLQKNIELLRDIHPKEINTHIAFNRLAKEVIQMKKDIANA